MIQRGVVIVLMMGMERVAPRYVELDATEVLERDRQRQRSKRLNCGQVASHGQAINACEYLVRTQEGGTRARVWVVGETPDRNCNQLAIETAGGHLDFRLCNADLVDVPAPKACPFEILTRSEWVERHRAEEARTAASAVVYKGGHAALVGA